MEMSQKPSQTFNEIEKDVNTEKKCSICEEVFYGHGNNASPIHEDPCCDKCNYEVIIPARLSELGSGDIK